MAFASTSTEFAMIDTRTTSGAFVLPLTTDIPGRIINIKDAYGTFTNSSLIVYTQGGEAFEDGTNFKLLNNSWDQLQVYTASTSRWYITGGTEQNITTTNIGVFSTVQTFNWPSLCNSATFGYGTQFNPAALGRIALLDNIFTSSTAVQASTFIEMGNLNAQPTIMSTGGAFRWLMGVEPDSTSMGRGLQFKVKRWNSFQVPNGSVAYGANISTLVETVNIDSRGFVGINNSSPGFVLDVQNTPANGDAFRLTGNQLFFTNSATAGPQAYGRITGSYTAGGGLQAGVFNIQGLSTIQFGPYFSGTSNMVIRTGPPGAADFGFVGIGTGAPGTTLDVVGQIRASTMSTLFMFARTASTNSIITSTIGVNCNAPPFPLTVFGRLGIQSEQVGGYGQLKLFPNALGNEAAIGFYSTVTEINTNMWMIGRSVNFGTVGNFAICPITAGTAQTSNTFTFTPTGQMGIANFAPFSTLSLDVNGMSRGKLFISSVTSTSISLLANSYGIYHNLTNTGFNQITLPVLTGTSNFGWYVLMRNATSVAMSVTFQTNSCNNIPSPLSIGSSNSVTLAWDGALFRVF